MAYVLKNVFKNFDKRYTVLLSKESVHKNKIGYQTLGSRSITQMHIVVIGKP